MGMYVGGGKCKFVLQGASHKFKIYNSTPITNGVKLLSFDDYILKDMNGLYLTIETEAE